MFDRYVGHVLDVVVPGTGPIWLDDVVCKDSGAADLSLCSHNDWGDHDCRHTEDVSVACYDRNAGSGDTTTTADSSGKQ